MTGPHPSLCGLPLYALINAYAGEPSLLGAAIYASSFDELRAKRAECKKPKAHSLRLNQQNRGHDELPAQDSA